MPLLGAFLLGCAAVPQEAQRACNPGFEYSEWLGTVIDGNSGVQVQELNDVNRRVFVANFNRFEPVTDFDPKRVLIFFRQGLPSVIIVFVSVDDCVVVATTVPINVIERLLTSARRSTDADT